MMKDLLRERIKKKDVIVIEAENILYLTHFFRKEDFECLVKQMKNDRGKFSEIDCWKNNICIRSQMVIELKKAIKQGKKIYIISEIPYGKQILEDILRKAGVEKYEEVLLTSGTNNSKEMIINELALEVGTEKILLVASSGMPLIKGIETIKIRTPLEMLNNSAYKESVTYCKTINDRLILARFINHVFNDPFVLREGEQRPRINKVYDLGYLFVGPIVTGFMLWLLNYAAKKDCKKLLFSARDGYLLQKLYDIGCAKLELTDMPESIYFQISRTLCVSATVYDEKDIVNYAGVRYRLEPEKMLERRFGLRKEEIKPFSKEQHKTEVNYALDHKEAILENSKRIRKNYLRYIDRLGLNKEENYILFDFVSSGTCQYLLDKISGLNIQGAYFCRYFPFEGITNYTDAEAKANLPIDAYIVNQSTKERESYLFKNYNFLETIFTSLQPSVYSMDEKGNPVLDEEGRTGIQLEYVREIHQAIIDFYNEFIEYGYIHNEPLSFSFLDKILNYKTLQYTDECCEVLNEFFLIEDFGQGKIWLDRK